MRRRDFIKVIVGAAATWPVAARAQQGRAHTAHRRAYELGAHDKEGQARLAAFLQGLQELGWIDGRNMRVDTRWGTGDGERVRKYIADLVAGLAPDVILASGGSLVAPLLQATRTVRIVFTQTPDPVGAVLLKASHAREATWPVFQLGLQHRREVVGTAQANRAGHDARGRYFGTPNTTRDRPVSAVHSLAPSLRVEVIPLNEREPGESNYHLAFTHSPNSGLS